MRKLFTLLFLLTAGLGLFGQSIPELFYYKFDGTGTSVPNLASTPPTGTATATLMGGLTQGTSEICDGVAIGSNNSSTTDYVNTGWATNLTGTSWTISFRTKNFGSTAALYYIFGDLNAGGFRCFTNGVAGANNWMMRGPVADIIAPGGAVAAPTMTTFVYNSVTGNTKSYVNGVLANTVTQSAPTIAAAGPFKVVGYSANIGAPLNGYLDEFRIYNRALTDIEISALYQGEQIYNFASPDTAYFCPGDSVQLNSNQLSGTTWSTGATTPSIYADSATTYSVSYTSLCAFGNDTLQVLSHPALPGPGFAGPDDTICTGDTLMLSVSSTDSIHWSTGDTTNATWVTSPGTYTVSISGACGMVEDTVRVEPSMLVYSGFAMADTSSACEGDTINLMSMMAYDTYMWSTGDTTQSTWVTTGGTYFASVSDGCGSGSDSVTVSFTPQVNAAFSSTVNQFGVVFVNNSTGGGTVTYAWDFGDGNSDTTMNAGHTYAGNGTYVVTLTVTNECGSSVAMDTIVINVIGVNNSLGFDLSVYPNPAKDQVAVSAFLTEVQDLRISVTSLVGQVLLSQNLTDVSGNLRQVVNLSSLATGVYFLKVEGATGKQVTRLVVE
jgi:hypothetical protein